MRKMEVAKQRRVVENMRQKNAELVFNIMPTHVAEHFMGAKKDDEVISSLDF